MANHSSVNYVEPNLTATSGEFVTETDGNGKSKTVWKSWKVDDDYERAPRLEDYSITVNLEVEVCSRNNISQSKKITSDVLILSYKTNVSNDMSVVNFMGGTKVKTGNNNYKPMQYLTTNYADMYVGDLIDYGTTEMIGIKSIDVEYLKSCVPIITIKFTDVRGLSLFQPTELSRTNEYQGIAGINADNVAQSFFQCFFRVPMPKFTITIKGFYGKPVTYEVMCDKFDTNFNSNTGDFDITTRFIGYSYSFLTDISIDALLAAPYSDYHGGKDYWDEKTKDTSDSGFMLWNKERTVKKPMPTLFEIWQEMKSLLKDNVDVDSSLTEEEKNHSQEILELQTLNSKYRTWYETLFNLLCERYGKEYCYLFKEDGVDGEYYRILILVNQQNSATTLAYEYQKFPDSFKQTNQDLFAAVETYNSKGNGFKKLENISDDFNDFCRSNLFNNLFINGKNEIVFNGFHKNCKLPKTQVTKHVFYGVNYYQDGLTKEEIGAKESQHKKHVLGTIYGDGTDQYVDCYSINVDYRSIRNRLNALQADANKDLKEKEHEKKIKALNKAMFAKMSWYPSVENFTRIMMAHLETLMRMMYNVIDKCDGRTAKKLGLPVDYTDVNTNNDVIPPFPRVTKNVLGEDNIEKIEDTWVGEYDKGEIPFEEVDFINGLFNAVERLEALKKDMETVETERGRTVAAESEKPIVKHPLSSFDFYITKSPYGSSSDISNDIKGYDFAGKVAIRMFDILSINNFRKEFSNKIVEGDLLKKIARIEADNFHDSIQISNDKLVTMIRDKVITPDSILKMVTSQNDDTDCPWGKKLLFDNSDSNMWLSGYAVKKSDYKNNFYPIQGYSFSKNEEWLRAFNEDKISNFDGSVSICNIPKNVTDASLLNDKSGLGTTFIFDNFNSVIKQLENANTSCDSGYTDYYNMISSACTFNDEQYNKFIEVKGTAPSICNSTLLSGASNFEIDGNYIKVYDSSNNYRIYSNETTSSFASQAKQGSLSNYTITEIFPPKFINPSNKNEGYKLDSNDSLKAFNFNGKGINVKSSCNGLELSCYETAYLLMGIKLNTNEIGQYLSKNHTVSYLPRLAVLQIGAILFASNGIHGTEWDKTFGWNLRKIGDKYIPIADTSEYAVKFILHINSLSKPAKMAYINYYVKWCNSHNEYANKLIKNQGKESDKHFVFPKDTEIKRRLLRENSDLVKEMTNELLSPVCVLRLSVNYLANQSKNSFALNKGKAKAYLESFIERLEEIYRINHTEDSNGNLIKTTDEPRKTTIDMKAELYRYMKQLYDKWLPMSSFSDWQLKSFFIDNSGEEIGHKFYFIDSYYNTINHKLLINPKILSEKIDALLSYRDVNAMMLGFMADIYASNKCMLMSIQNFADLKKENSMNEMFTPISFNSIDWTTLNKYPSFVVVYPYEPSKNLDIPNNEYTNDGFMLNDEFETPEAIRSKTDKDGQYKIPAFGVAYGKQYQSYFKSVNINMQSPIATQQSIAAKHFIIREAASTKEKGVVAQDLYDVYSTQSYTCEVEMMGCAWVQPLMYFVLLNVPMFRGSYMIMKVKHSIKPGDMTTRFTGCRMANVSNKIIEDMFTDEDFLADGSEYSAYENDKSLKADITNDCPYKIYPLFGDESTNLSGDKAKDGLGIMRGLIALISNKLGKQPTDEKVIYMAAGIVGNMAVESYDYKDSKKYFKYDLVVEDNSVSSKGTSGGLCMWRNGYLIDLAEKKTSGLGHNKTKLVYSEAIREKYSTLLRNNGLDAQLRFLMDTMKSENSWMPLKLETYYTLATSARVAASKFQEQYERPAKLDSKRADEAEDFYKLYKNGGSIEQQVSTPNKDVNKDINSALFEAVKKTCLNTPSIGIEIKNLGVKNGYARINQSNGKTDKLQLVFDVMLNSEYYNYIQELGWVYPSNGLQCKMPPDVIYYKAAQSPNPTSKRVWAVQYGKDPSTYVSHEIPDGNEDLLRPLAKRAKTIGNENNFKKEVPQIKDTKILDKYKPEDCNSLFNSGSNPSGPGDNSTWAKAVQTMGKWYEANIHTYQNRTPPAKGSGTRKMYDCSLVNGKVGDDCSGFVSACLQYFGVFKNGFIPSSYGFTYGSDVASILQKNKFTKINYSWDKVQPYDIISYNNNGKGHVEILAEKGEHPKSWGWGSVHDGKTYEGKTRDVMPAKTGNKPKGETYTTIWRYIA